MDTKNVRRSKIGHWFEIGERVVGEYYNQPFSGVVAATRVNRGKGPVQRVTVRLDLNIVVLGSVLETVQLDVDFEGNGVFRHGLYREFLRLDYRNYLQ
ncbi:MAG TPA: hypothetical protein VLU73_03415 [Methylococcaceae bacterium]|jgi:hypothetical protein|nr:hypothetical protein [Methylococcaceae bacterium]